jgi:Holliday junction DNA helicase RuvA
MIAYLSGTLAFKSPSYAVIDVRGVGYQVFFSLATYCRLPEPGEPIRVHVHTHVRDDALQLFGFLAVEERELFELLLEVQGIGPRLALSILSGCSPADLLRAIREGDAEGLVRIPGVGKKTAARLLVELRDKVGRNGLAELVAGAAPNRVEAEAVSALVNLGYRAAEAEQAVAAAKAAGAEDLESLIRNALKRMAA